MTLKTHILQPWAKAGLARSFWSRYDAMGNLIARVPADCEDAREAVDQALNDAGYELQSNTSPSWYWAFDKTTFTITLYQGNKKKGWIDWYWKDWRGKETESEPTDGVILWRGVCIRNGRSEYFNMTDDVPQAFETAGKVAAELTHSFGHDAVIAGYEAAYLEWNSDWTETIKKRKAAVAKAPGWHWRYHNEHLQLCDGQDKLHGWLQWSWSCKNGATTADDMQWSAWAALLGFQARTRTGPGALAQARVDLLTALEVERASGWDEARRAWNLGWDDYIQKCRRNAKGIISDSSKEPAQPSPEHDWHWTYDDGMERIALYDGNVRRGWVWLEAGNFQWTYCIMDKDQCNERCWHAKTCRDAAATLLDILDAGSLEATRGWPAAEQMAHSRLALAAGVDSTGLWWLCPRGCGAKLTCRDGAFYNAADGEPHFCMKCGGIQPEAAKKPLDGPHDQCKSCARYVTHVCTGTLQESCPLRIALFPENSTLKPVRVPFGCPICFGSGRVWPTGDSSVASMIPCHACKGTGLVWDPQS